MPIVISRQTGDIISKPEYTPDQIDRAWDQIIKKWADDNKDRLKSLAEEYASTPRDK